MIINRESYKNIFLVNNLEDFESEKMEDLLMCANSNWEVYFSGINKLGKEKVDYEKIGEAELIEFANEKEMFKFWNSLDNFKKINWSTEHRFPCILKYL